MAVLTKKFSQFASQQQPAIGNILVGLATGANEQFTVLWDFYAPGTTGQRPVSPITGVLRWNTTLGAYELWNGSAWVQLTDTTIFPLSMALGGTGAALTPSNGGIVYTNATTMAILAGTATANQVLLSGSSAAPAWSTATYPATTTINQILYSSAANTITGLATAANGVLVTSAGGVPSIAGTLPAAVQLNITQLGTIVTGTWHGGIIGLPYGGTNANLTASNGGIVYSTATALAILAGTATANQVLVSGANSAPSWSTSTFPATAGATGTIIRSDGTNWVASTSTFADTYAANSILYASSGNTVTGLATAAAAVLTTVASVPTWAAELSLALGGTNASLTASNGGIFYSTATAGAILAGTATANQALLSGASSAPAWSTATYPASTTINQILYSSANNTITGLATANDGVLITSGAGVPSISGTLPLAVQGNITTLGTIVTGVWNGTGITVPFGGTGNSTFTAYAVICAGTTATGAFQNVSGVGTAGQLLTSNGAGALPTWQNGTGGTVTSIATNNGITGGTITTTGTIGLASVADQRILANISGGSAPPSANTLTAIIDACIGTTQGDVLYRDASGWVVLPPGTSGQFLQTQGAAANVQWASPAGSGTVSAGLQNQLAYYAANGTTVSGLATANSGVLVTSSGGVPSISTTLPSGLTIPGYQSTALTSAHILVGNGSNIAADVAVSGDLTLANTGAFTIANSAVTNAKLANMADQRVKGNVSGGSAAPSDLTKAQILTFLSNPFNSVNIQVFTSSGTYTPTSGMVSCIAEGVGGGGGGGGINTLSGSYSGAGGGGGCYSRSAFSAATIGASQTVTIGAGGSAGGTGGTGGTGGNGGQTSLGSLLTAPGGSGGAGGVGVGGTGGVAGTAQFSSPGENGQNAITSNSTSIIPPGGNGGASLLGCGATITVTNSSANGNAGSSYGGGGSGGMAYNTASGFSGGAGAPGILIVTEFISG